MTSAPDFTFLMILNDPEIAEFVTQRHYIRPMVDLEKIGKEDRQGHLNTWKSSHSMEDVTRVREAAPEAELIVRVNPLHTGSSLELDEVIARGADFVMLPMFNSKDELAKFFDLLNGRAKALPLFETASSVEAIPEILETVPLTDAHFGLNDLHLSLGCGFMFQPLSEGYLDNPASLLNEADVCFGIGGIARASEGHLQPEVLLGEHTRLGSKSAILSRTFHRNSPTLKALKERMDFYCEVEKLLAIKAGFDQQSNSAILENRLNLIDTVENICSQLEFTGSNE